MFSNKKDLANVISILVHCSHDNSFLLVYDEERGDYWIPSMKMLEKDSWKDNLQTFKKKLFDYEVINEKLLKILKIWTLEKDYFHLIFQINLSKEIKTNSKSQTQFGVVRWHTASEILKLRHLLRSLEILTVIHSYLPQILRQKETVTGEVVPMGPLTEIREVDILVNAENTKSQIHVDLLEAARIPEEEQYDLYEEFFIQTYPCIYMNSVAFKRTISKFCVPGTESSLFRAADVWKRDFLTFQDYLYLIAVMEPYTIHYGHLAEIRCQYIFRYYNKKGDGKLDYTDLENLICDIELAENADKASRESSKIKVESITKLLNFKTNSLMTFEQFYSHVLQCKIRNTPLLLRFEQSHYDVVLQEMKRDFSGSVSLPSRIVLSPAYNSVDHDKGADFDYKIVLKTTILKPGEIPLQVKDLRFLKETMTTSVSEYFKIVSNIRLTRIDSLDLEAKINELLLALRYFCTEICNSAIFCGEFEFEEKDAYSWGSAYLEKLGVTLMLMCEQLKEIFGNEPRLLEIEAPVYIMGDLHGNFHDLMCFEKTLWPCGVPLVPAKLLFLGDYVDRGFNSLEVVMYLFANKIQNPNKLYLIRGNHEIRDIQKMFTFQKECIYKLGSTFGAAVWKTVNDVFDMMPIAAVVDRKVFCCHGGIPPPWLCPVVSVINSIPCPLVNCERQSPLAWSIMWNDPLKIASRNSVQESELLAGEGFIPNFHRGTGYIFSCDALERFLLTNNLSHVVRAHEVVKAGFQVHQKGKLLTVFSSSAYCGGKNYAGSVLVSDKLLRVFMVDTGMN